MISIYTEDHLESLTFGHNCEIVDYQPRPGADINGDEEYERYWNQNIYDTQHKKDSINYNSKKIRE